MAPATNRIPFLNWAGGKRRVLAHIRAYLPPEFGAYWEPFLGAGALFFAISPSQAHLSDLNADLISCFQFVRDRPELVARHLAHHRAQHGEEHYYAVRTVYSVSPPSAAQAARFIYLNKACFNAIYRVNRKGQFNVPFGFKDVPSLPTLLHLRSASAALSAATFYTGSYDTVLSEHTPAAADFVYLDPPYPPLNHTSNFRHYTAGRFSIHDHKKLSQIAHELSSAGALVLVSNADLPEVRALYRGWTAIPLPVTRWLAANGSRHIASELLIMNYKVHTPE